MEWLFALYFMWQPPMSTHKVPECLIKSIEFHESRGKPLAVSSAGAIGTMQVMPRFSNIPRWQLYSIAGSRHEGTRILCRWHRRAKGDLRLALAGYNGGNRGLRGEMSRALGYADRVISRAGRKGCLTKSICGRRPKKKGYEKPQKQPLQPQPSTSSGQK